MNPDIHWYERASGSPAEKPHQNYWKGEKCDVTHMGVSISKKMVRAMRVKMADGTIHEEYFGEDGKIPNITYDLLVA